MRVISYNIQYGKGMDGRFDLERSCAAVRGADIICLQEVDQYWRRSGDVDTVSMKLSGSIDQVAPLVEEPSGLDVVEVGHHERFGVS